MIRPEPIQIFTGSSRSPSGDHPFIIIYRSKRQPRSSRHPRKTGDVSPKFHWIVHPMAGGGEFPRFFPEIKTSRAARRCTPGVSLLSRLSDNPLDTNSIQDILILVSGAFHLGVATGGGSDFQKRRDTAESIRPLCIFQQRIGSHWTSE